MIRIRNLLICIKYFNVKDFSSNNAKTNQWVCKSKKSYSVNSNHYYQCLFVNDIIIIIVIGNNSEIVFNKRIIIPMIIFKIIVIKKIIWKGSFCYGILYIYI